MIISETKGDLFDAPDGAALIHACNCVGSWGGGIARAFRDRYPAAYKVYNSHCRNFQQKPEQHTIIDSRTSKSRTLTLPLGTALLIPPQEVDIAKSGKRNWIICLFTSRAFGRSVSPPDVILENTVHAIRDMRRQIEELREGGGDIARDGKVYSCRFNSGLFHVKWEDSKAVLEKEINGMDAIQKIVVIRPEGEE
ncbi:ADP-ribose 1''-phosphate phosphatase [Talaromyces islandicus]|uniref:ADP-ribose 1''-phosphate phosphatase n=1 Tax=Talaromyces islandicus TaxID=28573 RepID=A0A0U1M7R8_TALIS|nr:ADP-ribose 1''-phosphate phosphatase [Talaromyces islandicus]